MHGTGLGSAEWGWDPGSDMEPRLGRSGSELREAFFFVEGEEETQ